VPHSIRLRDPWSLLPATPAETIPDPPAVAFTFSRKFNAPTGLAPLQSVVLELTPTPLAQRLTFQLNGQPLNGQPVGNAVAGPPYEHAGEAKATTEPSSDAASERERRAPAMHPLKLELRKHLQAFNVLLVTIETNSSQALPAIPQFHHFCEARLLL
jgi:hypothetical protein